MLLSLILQAFKVCDFIKPHTSEREKFHPLPFFRVKVLIELGTLNAHKINITNTRAMKLCIQTKFFMLYMILGRNPSILKFSDMSILVAFRRKGSWFILRRNLYQDADGNAPIGNVPQFVPFKNNQFVVFRLLALFMDLQSNNFLKQFYFYSLDPLSPAL